MKLSFRLAAIYRLLSIDESFVLSWGCVVFGDVIEN